MQAVDHGRHVVAVPGAAGGLQYIALAGQHEGIALQRQGDVAHGQVFVAAQHSGGDGGAIVLRQAAIGAQRGQAGGQLGHGGFILRQGIGLVGVQHVVVVHLHLAAHVLQQGGHG